MTSETATTATEEPTGPAGPARAKCDHCRGTGYELTTNDLIRESLALFPSGDPAQMDEFVREFYRRLLSAAPDLTHLFPEDLVTSDHTALDSKGKSQRDRLLSGILTSIGEYDPADVAGERMEARERHLEINGRSHATFPRPFGPPMGATAGEYALVGQVLMALIHDVFGQRWRPEYDLAWAEAYADTTDAMLWYARQTRRDAAREGRTLFTRTTRRAR